MPADRVADLLAAGLVVVLNGAAEEVRIGRLDPDDAPWFIDAILLPAFTATETGER